MADRIARDPIEELSRRLAAVESQLTELRTKSLVIPVLTTDPSTDYAGNIWIYPDGKLNIRLKDGTIKQVAMTAQAANTGSNPAPTAQPITRVSSWTAQWGQAYRQSGGFTGSDNSTLQYGSSGDSYNGNQRSLVGFDYASIQSTLSGAGIIKAELWVQNLHTWYYNGGTLWVGFHNNTVKPGSWGGTIGRDFVSSFHVPNVGNGWHDISTEFGSKLRDNGAKGITFQAPNNDRQYYGYAAGGPGTPTSQMPVLRITYLK